MKNLLRFFRIAVLLLLSVYIGDFARADIPVLRSSPVKSIAWQPDGSTIAFGYQNGQIYIRDTQEALLQVIPAHASKVLALAWYPDGSLLAASIDKPESGVTVWDTTTWTPVSFSAHIIDEILALEWLQLPSGTFLIGGNSGISSPAETIRYWDMNGVVVKRGLIPNLVIVASSVDKTKLAVGGNGSFRVVDTATLQTLKYRRTQTGDTSIYASAILLSSDSQHLITGHYNGYINIWDVSSSSPLESDTPSLVLNGTNNAGSISPENTILDLYPDNSNNELSSVSGDGTVRVWNATTGTLLREIHLNAGEVLYAAKFSPDGKKIAFGLSDMSVKFVDVPR